MADFFDRVERELMLAVAGSAAPATVRRRRAGTAASAIAVSAVVLLTIVVAAVVVPGHEHPSAASGVRPRSNMQPCVAVHGPACLVAQYSVFRRPQTADERATHVQVKRSWFFAGPALDHVHIKVVPALTRLVTVRSHTLMLFAIKVSIGPPNYIAGAELLVDGRARFVDVGYPFIPVGPLTGRRPARWVLLATAPTWIDGTEIAVVPDRVHRVQWAFSIAGRGNRSVSTNLPVTQNVAATFAPRPKGHIRITETGADGQIVAMSPG